MTKATTLHNTALRNAIKRAKAECPEVIGQQVFLHTRANNIVTICSTVLNGLLSGKSQLPYSEHMLFIVFGSLKALEQRIQAHP